MILPPPPPRRRSGLTPMIDVVFLLLVFFMLAARFGQDMMIPLQTAGASSAEWQGAPRLVTLTPDGLRLNGLPVAPEELGAALAALMPAPDAPVLLRAEPGVPLQALTALIDRLTDGGIATLVLVE